MYYLSQMYEYLLGLDENLLLLVNGYHTPFLDKVMWTISDRWAWMPLYMLLTVILCRKSGLKMGLFALLLIAALIAATDQTCASVIRPALCRLRPSNPDNPVSALVTVVNGYHGGAYGFPRVTPQTHLLLRFSCR